MSAEACTHTRPKYVPCTSYGDHGEPYEDGMWMDVTTCVDLGLHSYRCTRCGKVFYYSQRAEQAAQGNDNG